MTKTEAIVGLIDLVIDAVPFGSTLPISQVYSAWTAFQTPQFAKQKDKLLKKSKEFIKNSSISEAEVQELYEVLEFAMTYITDAKVLQYRMNHKGLKEELIAEGRKKLGGWTKEEGILDAYKKYIHKYVDFIYQNFTQLEIVSDPVHYHNLELAEKQIRNQEAMMQEHSQIASAQNEQSTQMLDQFQQMRELLQKIINVICNPNASANTILDMDTERLHTEKEFLNGFFCDNQRYAENFTSILFGEDDGSNIMESSPAATLSDVYISPKAIFSDEKEYPIEAIINQFASRKEHSLLTIYGKPGVGKSTLASCLAYVNEGNELPENTYDLNLLKDRFLFLRLRDEETCALIDDGNPWESIKNCFHQADDNLYQDKILVLDGLDEVCVLKKNFNGATFIERLKRQLPVRSRYGSKVIILTRAGYFNIPAQSSYCTITWLDEHVVAWCDKYTHIHNERLEWKEQFLAYFKELKDNEEAYQKIKEIFRTPLILYLCAKKGKVPKGATSICEIYENIFDVAATREYNTAISLEEEDKQQKIVAKQLAKELAYLLILQDKLEDETADNETRNKAQSRALTVLKENYGFGEIEGFEQKYGTLIKREYCISYFMCGNENGGVEFAHKTIAEYFTAVKLYEDYFKNLNEQYDVEQTWKMIYQAFCMKRIPADIMTYLIELIEQRWKKSESDVKCWKNSFFDKYYAGMESPLLWKQINTEIPEEYERVAGKLPPDYVTTAFRNLTWFLTGLGFCNDRDDNFVDVRKNIFSSYIQRQNMDLNCNNWKSMSNMVLDGAHLSGAYLSRAHLSGANLSGADLSGADLIGAYLIGAHLHEAHLRGADLFRASLSGANLSGADLIGARLNDANLRGANLSGADLIGADLIGAHLNDANLRGANLSGADLREADLSFADLRRAKYTKDQLATARNADKAILE